MKIERSNPSLRFAGLCAAILLGVAFAGAGCGGSGGGGHAGDGGAGAGGGAGKGDGAAGASGAGGQDAGSAGTTGSGGQADGAADAAQDSASEPDAADSGALDGSDTQSDAAHDGADAATDGALDRADAATDVAPLGWVLVRIGDCSGTDRAIGYSTGSDTPVDGDCTHAENGLAAVCWDQTTYHNELIPGTAAGCTYKTIAAASCTDGTRPGRLYVCNRP